MPDAVSIVVQPIESGLKERSIFKDVVGFEIKCWSVVISRYIVDMVCWLVSLRSWCVGWHLLRYSAAKSQAIPHRHSGASDPDPLTRVN